MPYADLEPDLQAARTFLQFLDPEVVATNKRFIFLWVRPGEEARQRSAFEEYLSADDFCKIYPARLAEHGLQPFVCVNAMRKDRRSNAEVARCRAFFLDFDAPPAHPYSDLLPPDAIVRSAGGEHWYWRCTDVPHTWRMTERALAVHFGADLRATDLARVLRVPGSWHLKDPSAPHLVTLERCDVSQPPRVLTPALVNTYGLDLRQAGAEVAEEIGASGMWTKSSLPHNLEVFFSYVRQAGYLPIKRPGKSEWTFKCPVKDHKSARVVVILNALGDWTLFCQSGKACCTRDAIFEKFHAGWGLRYTYKYSAEERRRRQGGQ